MSTDFLPGDTIRVEYELKEGDKARVQYFEGVVIATKGKGASATFTVRKIASAGVGVERIFPRHSPHIKSIKVVKKGRARRAKLYYLRKRVGKRATRVKA